MPETTPDQYANLGRRAAPHSPSEFLPLRWIEVDGIRIPADRIEGGNIIHDINAGTVSVTFCGVRHVETVYAHMPDDAEDSVRVYQGQHNPL